MLGYLPQEFGGWRLQRVEEVLDTLALLSGMKQKAARRERIAAVLQQVGLDSVADRKVKKLSGGMVRRLGVAQALIHEPRVLVVDEPTVGLDPQERLRFRQLMASLGQDRTIVLSTHIVADLGSSCQDLALIDAGKIVFRGAPEALVARAKDRVFQMEVEGDRDVPSDGGFEVVSRVAEGEKTRLRAVSADGRLPSGARPVEDPTLEEGYLAFMAARGRSEVALGEEES
jgi:ABC-type multidrug transport system ATPase subunit